MKNETRRVLWINAKHNLIQSIIYFWVGKIQSRRDRLSNQHSALVAQLVKNPPGKWKTWVPSMDWENTMEESMETHSSILDLRIPMARGD